jgi:hypothetical protein
MTKGNDIRSGVRKEPKDGFKRTAFFEIIGLHTGGDPVFDSVISGVKDKEKAGNCS